MQPRSQGLSSPYPKRCVVLSSTFGETIDQPEPISFFPRLLLGEVMNDTGTGTRFHTMSLICMIRTNWTYSCLISVSLWDIRMQVEWQLWGWNHRHVVDLYVLAESNRKRAPFKRERPLRIMLFSWSYACQVVQSLTFLSSPFYVNALLNLAIIELLTRHVSSVQMNWQNPKCTKICCCVVSRRMIVLNEFKEEKNVPVSNASGKLISQYRMGLDIS